MNQRKYGAEQPYWLQSIHMQHNNSLLSISFLHVCLSVGPAWHLFLANTELCKSGEQWWAQLTRARPMRLLQNLCGSILARIFFIMLCMAPPAQSTPKRRSILYLETSAGKRIKRPCCMVIWAHNKYFTMYPVYYMRTIEYHCCPYPFGC